MDGLLHLFWLVMFVALGFPVALGIERYRRNRRPAPQAHEPLHDREFMPVPADSAIVRLRAARTAAVEAPEPSGEPSL